MEAAHAQSSKGLSGKNILIGASGSVAAIRVPLLVDLLVAKGAAVKVVSTAHAGAFLEAERPLSPHVVCMKDEDEWRKWRTLSDPVLHIELRKWADMLVIAPLSANTLAKLANGICDNLLTCVARAWPLAGPEKKPFFVAPAMNTFMWDHPITAPQLQTLHGFGVHIIEPILKKLACGDTGKGAMEEPKAIVSLILSAVSRDQLK